MEHQALVTVTTTAVRTVFGPLLFAQMVILLMEVHPMREKKSDLKIVISIFFFKYIPTGMPLLSCVKLFFSLKKLIVVMFAVDMYVNNNYKRTYSI